MNPIMHYEINFVKNIQNIRLSVCWYSKLPCASYNRSLFMCRVSTAIEFKNTSYCVEQKIIYMNLIKIWWSHFQTTLIYLKIQYVRHECFICFTSTPDDDLMPSWWTNQRGLILYDVDDMSRSILLKLVSLLDVNKLWYAIFWWAEQI